MTFLHTHMYVFAQVLQKYLPGGFCGFDKEGAPVYIELYGHLDMKGILYSAKKLNIEKTKLLQGEETTRLLNEQTKKVIRRKNQIGKRKALKTPACIRPIPGPQMKNCSVSFFSSLGSI